MTQVLALTADTSSTATELSVISKADYPDWLAQQPQSSQDWLKACGFSGSGVALLPGTGEQLAGAVLVCESLDDVFAGGDLTSLLPARDYCLVPNLLSTEQTLNLAFAWGVGAYRFERYKRNTSPQPRLLLDDADLLKQARDRVVAVTLVRDLINTPAADMMPQDLAATTADLAERFGGVFSEVVGDELLAQNWPMIHAVGRASEHPSRVLNLRWGNPEAPRLTIVGKGVCFDSGGLDIKPADAMRLMKKDMGGAAHALGLASLVMSAGLNVNLRVIIPAVENAVAGNAFRPGDVINTRKGLTVEIDNTDAEGRLVLCDALTDAVAEQPELVIDFATLTGACRVALGTELPGLFCNRKDIARDLEDAGERVGDPVWQLPLHNAYRDALRSDIADLVNSVPGPFGGAITAALYLEAFVDNTPWVHFDVMAWNRRKLPGRPIGGEAMGIRAVFEYLQKRFG
ncbi:leucyl aminopeptidase family protein [Parathalassolituus penaei]|uniref:Leucyl aminopeptidase family protein n=1 Tax=Parathalassolituus penaei TaxID=2997323 RepID=A0A9X3EGL6_9GAMM|nr:leucyl aminopeptidase family protein [Parathalassolituus penaei]MCY0967202.1 leucyl aminopeptidase family protein [Parathalassolituus penaei]